MPAQRVIPAMNLVTIYDAPVRYHEEGFDTQVLSVFGIKDAPPPDLSRWRSVGERILKPEGEVRIAVVASIVDFVIAFSLRVFWAAAARPRPSPPKVAPRHEPMRPAMCACADQGSFGTDGPPPAQCARAAKAEPQ